MSTLFAGFTVCVGLVCWHRCGCRLCLLASPWASAWYAGIAVGVDLVCWHHCGFWSGLLALLWVSTLFAGITVGVSLVCWYHCGHRPCLLALLWVSVWFAGIVVGVGLLRDVSVKCFVTTNPSIIFSCIWSSCDSLHYLLSGMTLELQHRSPFFTPFSCFLVLWVLTWFAGTTVRVDLVCWHHRWCRSCLLASPLVSVWFAGIAVGVDLVCWHCCGCQIGFAGIAVGADLVCWHHCGR